MSNTDNYGFQIKEDISARTECMCDIELGTLYPSPHKLRNLGFLASYDSTNLSNKIMYSVTPAGRAVFNILDRIHNNLVKRGQDDSDE